MKSYAFTLLCMVCLLARAEDKAEPPTQEQIQKWVGELGSENFDLRRAAEASLRGAGEGARELLEKAAQSTDPEVKLRAGRLAGAIKTEPILRKMEAAATSQNMESDMKMTFDMMGTKMEMSGHYFGLADAKHFNMDAKASVMGQSIDMKIIADGTIVWTEVQMPGAPAKMVQKASIETMQKMGGTQGATPTQAVQDLRQRYVFSSLKEEKLGADDVYVMEGTLNQDFIEEHAKKMEEMAGKMVADMTKQQLEKMKKSRIFVAKSDLMFRKLESLDDAGDAVMTVEMSNLKLGAKYEDDKFKYTPPEGAQIQDMDEAMRMTKNMGAGGQMGDPVMPMGDDDDGDDEMEVLPGK